MFSNDELRLIFTRIRNDNPELKEGPVSKEIFEKYLAEYYIEKQKIDK